MLANTAAINSPVGRWLQRVALFAHKIRRPLGPPLRQHFRVLVFLANHLKRADFCVVKVFRWRGFGF